MVARINADILLPNYELYIMRIHVRISLWLFLYEGRGCEGIGVRSGKNGFMLLAGSRVSQKDASATCPEHVLRLREEYSDKMQDDILTENILFHSASAAASFLMMANVNGNLAWKTKEGTCLGEYRKKY